MVLDFLGQLLDSGGRGGLAEGRVTRVPSLGSSPEKTWEVAVFWRGIGEIFTG